MPRHRHSGDSAARAKREPADFISSAIGRHALASRTIIWLVAVVVGSVGPPPVVTPLDVSGTAARPRGRRLIQGTADNGACNECSRRKPQPVMLAIAGAPIPVTPVAAPVGAVATALEPVTAPIPAIVATVVTVSPILNIRHIRRDDGCIWHENRCGGSRHRRTDSERKR